MSAENCPGRSPLAIALLLSLSWLVVCPADGAKGADELAACVAQCQRISCSNGIASSFSPALTSSRAVCTSAAIQMCVGARSARDRGMKGNPALASMQSIPGGRPIQTAHGFGSGSNGPGPDRLQIGRASIGAGERVAGVPVGLHRRAFRCSRRPGPAGGGQARTAGGGLGVGLS